MIESTFNPIVREELYKNSFFPQIPVPQPNSMILLYASGSATSPLIISNERTVKVSDIRKGKYDKLVEIDLYAHTVKFSEELVSSDNISKFHISISASAHVIKPAEAYHRGIRDVASLVENSFIDTIQECASQCSIRDIKKLKEDLKEELVGICDLADCICVQNIIVNVKTDKKIEELLNKEMEIQLRLELETKKAEAAVHMQKVYENDITAIFAELADGRINATEATARSKACLSDDFDERMRQMREVANFIQDMEDRDLITKADSLNKVKTILGQLAIVGNRIPVEQIAQEPENMKLEDSHKEARNEFADFDED